MIFVFGAILQSIRIDTAHDRGDKHTQYAKHYKNSVGGKAALQAVAAAKAGGQTRLIGKTGDDELAKHILLRIRKHEVITSGVAKIDHLQTGTSVYLKHEDKTILALGASARTTADQIPPDHLSDKNFILIQTELAWEENSKLLEVAKDAEATTILNLSPLNTIEEHDVANTDILITNAANKNALGDCSRHPHITAIFLDDGGACTIQNGKTADTLPALKIEGIDFSHTEGSEDAFCGTFTAYLSNGYSIKDAAAHAQIAAMITASRAGAYMALPYIDEINEIQKALSETAS